uniref:Protein kinase domain-containing protein n=1 Tax=Chaetoceros debilis TaxID=122233 RepID=A0A7S3Q7H5_9STRA
MRNLTVVEEHGGGGGGGGRMGHLKEMFTSKTKRSKPYSPMNSFKARVRSLGKNSSGIGMGIGIGIGIGMGIGMDGPVDGNGVLISNHKRSGSGLGSAGSGSDDTTTDDDIRQSNSDSSTSVQSAVTVASNATFSSVATSNFSLLSYRGKGSHDLTIDAFQELDDGINNYHKNHMNHLISNSNTSTVLPQTPMQLEKHNADAHSQALNCIANKNFDKLANILNKNPSILMCRTTKESSKLKGLHGHHGGTLLHVLASQKPKLKKKRIKMRGGGGLSRSLSSSSSATYEVYVSPSVPESVLDYVIKMQPEALITKDKNGRLPIHCATLALAVHLEEMATLYGNNPKTGTRKGGTANYEVSRFVFAEINKVQLLLKRNSDAASVRDRKGNLPIHYAAALLPDYTDPIHTKFSKGRKYGTPSAVNTVKGLLKAYPRGLTIENKLGMLPIHVLVSMGKDINQECLKMMISGHQAERDFPTERDPHGDPPLFGVIKSGASHEVVRLFATSAAADNNSTSSRFFIQRDGNNNNALHVALLQGDVPDVDVINTILDAAPFTASSPDCFGKMPIVRATKLRLDKGLIRRILARDMPIEIGTEKGESISLFGSGGGGGGSGDSSSATQKLIKVLRRKGPGASRHVVGRTHHHSWWFILVDCEDRYLRMIQTFLSEEATLFQIVSLARQIGPDGKSVLINCVTDKCRFMFHSLLRFYDRYEILLSTNETKVQCDDVVDGVQTFLALDHGPMPTSYDAKNPSSMVPSSHAAVKVQRDGSMNSEVEVSLLSKDGSKVVLRCYMYEEEFFAELKVREKYKFPSNYFEELRNHHHDESFTHLTLSKSDNLCCITYERPDHTLSDVFASVSGGTRSKKWVEKCWVVLKQIAEALKCLHDQSLVHGHLEPANVCKYGNVWKIAKVGTVVKNGAPMRGTFRSCVPPESIVASKLKRGTGRGGRLTTPTIKDTSSALQPTLVKKSSRVKFSPGVPFIERKSTINIRDNRDDRHTSSRKSSKNIEVRQKETSSNDSLGGFFKFGQWGSSDGEKENSEKAAQDNKQGDNIVAAAFTPERVVASPAWDMWGFGLIMTQMLLGRCMHLPNFEKANDAIFKKLQNYDDEALQMVCNQLLTAVGREATDLVYLLLQKDPSKRPKSMEVVLTSDYFKALTIYV